MTLRTGIVGATGKWGGVVLRSILSDVPELDVVAAVVRGGKERPAPENLGHVRVFQTWEGMLREGRLDAVVVASAASTHAAFVRDALRRRLHVFVEKPFAATKQDALKLHEAYRRLKPQPVLLCDHVQLFNTRFEAIHADSEKHGGAAAIRIHMTGRGPYRHDCSPLWDYGAHAVAMAILISRSTEGPVTALTVDGPHLTPLGYSETVAWTMRLGKTDVSVLVSNAMDKTYFARVDCADGTKLEYDGLAAPSSPPLSRALKLFAKMALGDVDGTDPRFGSALPTVVTTVLAKLDEAMKARGITRPQRQEPTLPEV